MVAIINTDTIQDLFLFLQISITLAEAIIRYTTALYSFSFLAKNSKEISPKIEFPLSVILQACR